MPQDTENKNLCKHTQDAQKFQVTPAKGMTYINGTATRMTVCIDNSQHPLIIDGGAHCSIVARNYLDHHSPNWENKLFPTKAQNFKSASGKMTSIGTIIKEIIIPHRKGNIRLNPEFVVLEDAVTTMEIHSLGPQYGISMPYPIYGNLVISIITGKIGHYHFYGLYGHFITWGHPGPFTILRPFLASFCFWAILARYTLHQDVKYRFKDQIQTSCHPEGVKLSQFHIYQPLLNLGGFSPKKFNSLLFWSPPVIPIEHSTPARKTRSQARAQAVLTPTPRAPLNGTSVVHQLRAQLDRGPILEGAAPSRKEGRGPRRLDSFSGVVGRFPGL
ncbi:hypothetical protein O181_052412 [Austropuccinia psidii MF-1]|uniref:Uncharacterized protein n=1 Tax=Austropuccinia psidii MF-1 TaxID=1389203 RepID=A0A9Q3HQH5_9BASI|nr:hypothetical protein [Austropuccinia psidii MF-1]